MTTGGTICGLWNYAGSETEGLGAMLTASPGCPPDAYGKWTEASLSLGWRGRAPAEEESAETLPRFNAESGLAVTASARLDGRATLCGALGVSRPDWTKLPDSSLILRSYERWGRDCPEHLLGDYTFALWDAAREILFCARDHIGTRPFYYALAGGRFAFASDIDALLAAPGVSDELDETAVATRLTRAARSLGARTYYRAVRRLLPGHSLSIARGTVRVHRWWRPEEIRPTSRATDDTVAEACLAVLSEAVRDRVRGARKVGVHLSGGLDSSCVAVLAARELRRHGRPAPPAFAWHPPPGSGPNGTREAAEYGAIEAVRRQEVLQVFYRSPKARDVIAFLRRDATRVDEGSLVHEEVVQRAAAEQSVTVLLSGWGGDEGISFNGRGYYPQLLRSGRWGRLWRELRDRSRCPVAALLTQALSPLVSPGAAVWARELRQGRLPLRRFPFRKNVTFIHPDFGRRVRPLRAPFGPPRAGVRDMQVYLLRIGGLSRRMEGWAASGARRGIEYRYPLLDRRVLEFALGLPAEQFRRGHWSRWAMRRALVPVLPPEVCWNADKTDPARFEPLRDAVAEALPAVRRMIEERSTPPARSQYVDLPRLLEHLHRERWRARGKYAPVLNALRFLDF